jgi:hypothetical protein
VHADATQKRFGGEGDVNTDDHNVLEYGSPIAYFVAADVRVPDSRRLASERDTLELSRFLQGRPLRADEAKDLYASLAWVHPPDDPLVRAAAASWLDAEPTSLDAALAYAKAALREGDVIRAHDTLAPHVQSEPDSPAFWAAWLEISRRFATREGAPWHAPQVDLVGAEMKARKSLEAHPDDEPLKDLLESKSP